MEFVQVCLAKRESGEEVAFRGLLVFFVVRGMAGEMEPVTQGRKVPRGSRLARWFCVLSRD
ncbi:MAG TPA: hypothetical protein DDY91_24370 [Planctomycetaceae bacterium]|nr:hypothetical protein [Planctomycetaceae bacterium]